MIWLEDVAVGDVTRFGEYRVTRDEVVAFAERYDPSPFTCPTKRPPPPISGGCRPADGIPPRWRWR